MSTSPSSRKLVEIPSCSICAENYDEKSRIPKCLACFHTFCASCLEDFAESKSSIECPNCRKPTTIPEKGISGLTSNFALLEVVSPDSESGGDDPQKQLEELKSLYDQGLLTEDVFKEKQRALVGSLITTSPQVTVRVTIPDEIGGGIVNVTLPVESKAASLKQSVVSDLQVRLGSSLTIPLDNVDFGLSRTLITSEDLIDEKNLVDDDAKITDASFATAKDKVLLAHLVNLTGGSAFGSPSKSAQWAKDRQERAKREKERLSGSKETPKPAEKKSGDPWSESVVLDLEGKEVKISQKWVKNRAVLCMVRRFGCAMCQHQSILLMQLKPKLDQIGVPLIIVGNGPSKAGVKYKTGLKWDGDVFTDPESKMYKLMALPRLTVFQTMKRFLGRRVIKLFKQYSKLYTSSDAEGDGQQTGGVFVVGPGAGRPLRYSFLESENEPDQFADADSVLYAAGWTPDMTLRES